MDKNYGLPLIFKAVNVETGEEWEGDYPYMVYSGTKKHKIRLTPHHANIALLQQTGFTDAAGKVVYFGDVLCKADFSTLWFGRVIVDQRGQIKVCKTEQPYDGASLAGAFDLYHIVGNAYEPPARWLERAREIWPDAELAEGVRG